MKKLIIILFCVSLGSCSDSDTVFSIEEGLENYVQPFYDEAEARGVSIPQSNFIFKTVDNLHSTMVFGKDGDQRFLHINSSALNQLTDEQIEHMVFHYLGNVLLGREKIKPTQDTPYVYSIMFTNRLFQGFNDQNNQPCGGCRDILIDELFD
jgi:hypothetical protein